MKYEQRRKTMKKSRTHNTLITAGVLIILTLPVTTITMAGELPPPGQATMNLEQTLWRRSSIRNFTSEPAAAQTHHRSLPRLLPDPHHPGGLEACLTANSLLEFRCSSVRPIDRPIIIVGQATRSYTVFQLAWFFSPSPTPYLEFSVGPRSTILSHSSDFLFPLKTVLHG